MSAFIGYADGAPTPTGPAYLDPIGGYNGAAAILTALHERRTTGRGQYVEISQVEAAMPLIGGLVLACLENDEPPTPNGNRLPVASDRLQGGGAWTCGHKPGNPGEGRGGWGRSGCTG